VTNSKPTTEEGKKNYVVLGRLLFNKTIILTQFLKIEE